MMRNLYLVLALCLFFPAGLFAQVDTLQTVVYFDVGQSILRADARVRLDVLLQRRGEADWVRVEFTGRTDHDGDLAANLRLAKRRIASVQAYLNEKGGLAADVCGSLAKGEADPLADNATPIGKSINRSVLVECKVRRRPVATMLEPAGMQPGRLPDTVKLPPVVPYDADCQRDTTIVLPQGTQLVFNRCEYLELQSGLEFEEALSARAALAQGLSTEETSGEPLTSCGMLRITLRSGRGADSCFKVPVRVRTLAPDPKCMPCTGAPSLFQISGAAWQPVGSESPKIELVKDQGKMYYQYEIRCPGGWKNCDCRTKVNQINVKAPFGYKIESATISMECPMVVVTRTGHRGKRRNMLTFSIPCPNSTVYLGYTLVSLFGKRQVVERKPIEKFRGKNPFRDCENPRDMRIRRVLGIFTVYRHRLYHTYFLLPKRRAARLIGPPNP